MEKTLKCRNCGKPFKPLYHNGIVKSKTCIECLVEKGKKKRWQIEKKKLKEDLKTKGQWLTELQKVFNLYIRLRDKDKPCISCGCALSAKYDAGHYFTVGAYPNIRFNEDNVHAQCVFCNQHNHGNIAEYTIQLPLRIGQERFDKLLEERSKPLNITIQEIKEKIKEYKQKIKQLKQ